MCWQEDLCAQSLKLESEQDEFLGYGNVATPLERHTQVLVDGDGDGDEIYTCMTPTKTWLKCTAGVNLRDYEVQRGPATGIRKGRRDILKVNNRWRLVMTS